MIESILIVCEGNICRSPMAEALANKYGADVLVASSAGFTPAVTTVTHTRKVLAEKNVILGDHRPKSVGEVDMQRVDILINMSGQKIPAQVHPVVEEWKVFDPYGASEDVYRQACSAIEMKVMNLILRIRSGKI